MIKGALKLSPTKDLPILERLRSARAMNTAQLLAWCQQTGIARSKGAMYSRLARLEEHELIGKVQRTLGPFAVYSIRRDGLRVLEQRSYFPSLTSAAKTICHPQQVPHSLLLQDIRSAFERNWGATEFLGDLQVQAFNTIRPGGSMYCKNFDAVTFVSRAQWALPPVRIAIELEMNLKSKPAEVYGEIARKLDTDSAVRMVLYICPSSELIRDIRRYLRPSRMLVAFTTIEEVLSPGLAMRVTIPVEERFRHMLFDDLLNRLV